MLKRFNNKFTNKNFEVEIFLNKIKIIHKLLNIKIK